MDMKMNSSSLRQLLLLLLAFSLLLSTTAAVPTSRSLKSIKDTSALQGLHDEVMAKNGELLVVEEIAMEGRMDLENTDYPGTGANNRHDPRSPGRF